MDFNRTVGKSKIPDKRLRQLIDHFNHYGRRNDNFEFPDLLGAAYEYLIKEFADLDRELIVLNRARVRKRLLTTRPTLASNASPTSDGGILLGELRRKRRHMPIRRLVARIGPLLQKIKPCFMMSPLSVAQYLGPGSARFDTLIFDEAGKPQLGLRADQFYSFIFAQLIQDYTSGAQYKLCIRPGCGKYFYYGSGTGKRNTSSYCTDTCQKSHYYQTYKGQRK